MASHDFRAQRLFVDATLGAGAVVETGRGQANYLLNVLRMKDGDTIHLFNGRDGEWRAIVRPQGRKACQMEVVELLRPQPPAPDLHYCFAPLKQARLDYMVQKAVEMGAGILQPVITQYTQSSRVNLERMQANAIEAAEQCGILAIPECREPAKLETLIRDWPAERLLVFADEAAAERPAIGSLETHAGRKAGLLVGPEGGFSPAEREMLRALPFTLTIGLGPRILRADTAAVAALAILQATIGDWPRGKHDQ